jgi:hypothetical protein
VARNFPNSRRTITAPRKHYLWLWFLWLGGFYAVWAWLIFGHGQWPVAKARWPMALSMALGSCVVGSTPMGGGTVGFRCWCFFVVLGAPLGAFMVDLVGRKPTLLFVAVLCVGQFIWTCMTEH